MPQKPNSITDEYRRNHIEDHVQQHSLPPSVISKKTIGLGTGGSWPVLLAMTDEISVVAPAFSEMASTVRIR
jgi:hypothetical protein